MPIRDVRGQHAVVEEVGVPFHEAPGPAGSLGQDLVDVPGPFQHHLEHPPHERLGDVLVEEVAHAVHEDLPRLPPAERILQAFRPEPHRERVTTRDVGIRLRLAGEIGVLEEAVRQDGSVAVVAACRHTRAPRDRVPRGVRPLNAGFLTHSSSLASGWRRLLFRRKASVWFDGNGFRARLRIWLLRRLARGGATMRLDGDGLLGRHSYLLRRNDLMARTEDKPNPIY